MFDQIIIKEAGFFDGFFSTISEKFDLKHKPFELAMGTLVPSMVMNKHPIFGALLFLAEAAGYGPGQLEVLIDKSLGLREGETPKDRKSVV